MCRGRDGCIGCDGERGCGDGPKRRQMTGLRNDP